MKNKINKVLVVILTAFLFASSSANIVEAVTREQGDDWSKFNGQYGKFGYSTDKFSISQIGGTYGGVYVDQYTYPTQVQSTIAQGKRAHTYIWLQVGNSVALANQAMDRYLPKVQTPKNSIVAVDYEAGASSDIQGNTTAILTAMNRIKAAGYTPMYYSYKPYTLAHVDYQRILRSYPNSLWIAAYPSYNLTVKPNYNYFPTMDGIAIWQFTSTYIAGGLDGNVDLTGITYNGYSKHDNPKSDTPAVDSGKQADDTSKKEIKIGNTVKVNFGASRWATGQLIPRFAKGHAYKVQQVAGNKVLLAGIYSWANKKDVEILDTNSTPQIKVDGYWGRDVTKSLQKVFNQRQDGVVSSQVKSNNLTSVTYGHKGSLLIRSIQRRLGVPVDGFLGSQTIRAIQHHYGTYVDGKISKNSSMVRTMQQSLNQNKF